MDSAILFARIVLNGLGIVDSLFRAVPWSGVMVSVPLISRGQPCKKKCWSPLGVHLGHGAIQSLANDDTDVAHTGVALRHTGARRAPITLPPTCPHAVGGWRRQPVSAPACVATAHCEGIR